MKQEESPRVQDSRAFVREHISQMQKCPAEQIHIDSLTVEDWCILAEEIGWETEILSKEDLQSGGGMIAGEYEENTFDWMDAQRWDYIASLTTQESFISPKK